MACEQAPESDVVDPSNLYLDSAAIMDPQNLLNAINEQLATQPEDFTLWQQRAEIYYRLDSPDAALADIEHAIGLNRNEPDLYYLKGFFSYGLGNVDEAKLAYLTAEGLGTQNPEVYYQLGQVYFFVKNDDSARYYYRRAQKFNEGEPHYVFAQGLLEEERGRYQAAVSLYLEALEVDSSFDKALIQLHKRYMDKPFENETVAMQYLNQLLRQQPGHALGRYYEGLFQLRRAERFLAANQMESFGEALNQAISGFSIATNRQPTFGEAWYYQGYAYFIGQERIAEAMNSFQRSIEVSPQDPRPYFMLGSIYERTGDLQTALSFYEKALARKPTSASFQRAVADLRAKLG